MDLEALPSIHFQEHREEKKDSNYSDFCRLQWLWSYIFREKNKVTVSRLTGLWFEVIADQNDNVIKNNVYTQDRPKHFTINEIIEEFCETKK